jgi:hypothetical protein
MAAVLPVLLLDGRQVRVPMRNSLVPTSSDGMAVFAPLLVGKVTVCESESADETAGSLSLEPFEGRQQSRGRRERQPLKRTHPGAGSGKAPIGTDLRNEHRSPMRRSSGNQTGGIASAKANGCWNHRHVAPHQTATYATLLMRVRLAFAEIVTARSEIRDVHMTCG